MAMQLRKLSYKEENGHLGLNPWSVTDVNLTELNLIVGENSVGKTRLLNIVFSLAQTISERRQMSPGHWVLTFDSGKDEFEYELVVSTSREVTKEIIKVAGSLRLEREGEAKIWNGKTGEVDNISPPKNKLTLQVRRDEAEYPFLEQLAEWADNLWLFRLSDVSASNVLVTMGATKTPEIVSNPQIMSTTPEIFRLLNEDSVATIVGDMNTVGFKIDAVHAGPKAEYQFATLLDVSEKGLEIPIAQTNLSNGFLRTLELFVVVEYVLAAKKGLTSTILIDDLDEGLDYERASKLAKLLFRKLKNKNIQLVATTNSSFIMNTVDLDSWNVLIRKGTRVRALNSRNSEELFERFRTTGLSNFEFFASDYLSGS